jgi:hypothetical protein
MELAVNTSYNPQVGLTAPRHGFRHGRYFFDSQGWYVRLRPGDEQLLERITVRIAERGVDALVVGPFPTRRSLQRWFEGFIELHGRDRHQHDVIPDDVVIRRYRPGRW